MRRFLFGLIPFLVLFACAPATPDGTPTQVNAPQAVEQCHAQPWLDWCKRS